MKRSAPRYLAFTLLPYRLFAYPDTVFNQFLVVEYQVLFQSCVRDIATLGGLLHRNVAVGTQKFHRIGILFPAPRARTARQVVVQSQPLPFPLPKFQHFGIMRVQLAAEVRPAQSESAGDLRYVALNIFRTVTRRDGLLVFGVGCGMLPAPLVHLDAIGFLRAALDAVAFQHQMAMVGTYIAGESAKGHPALPTYLGSGEVGGSVQLQCRTIFRFRLRLARSCSVAFVLCHGRLRLLR